MAYVEFISKTENTISLKVSGMQSLFKTSNYTRAGVSFSLPAGFEGGTSSPSAVMQRYPAQDGSGTEYSTETMTLYGLDPNTTLTFYGWAQLANFGTYWTAGSLTVTTNPPYVPPTPTMPTPTLDTGATVKTSNSLAVTINWQANVSNYFAGIDYGTMQYSTGRTFMFSGLSPSTPYTIRIKVSGSGYLDSNINTYTATTLAANVRPSNWAWQSTIVQGGVIGITASEWNAFCARINSFRSYKSLSTITFTNVSSGMTINSAYMNQARDAINQCSPSISAPSYVSQYTTITASLFNGLKNSINSIN
jgi:hypothetical protein